MPRVTAVAGRALEVKCPVAGYPIEAITWEKGVRVEYLKMLLSDYAFFITRFAFLSDGMTLPVNRRQRVFPNGTLRVEQVQKQTDAGTYTCQARNKHKHTVRRDLEVQVLGISFSSEVGFFVVTALFSSAENYANPVAEGRSSGRDACFDHMFYY